MYHHGCDRKYEFSYLYSYMYMYIHVYITTKVVSLSTDHVDTVYVIAWFVDDLRVAGQ